MNKITASLFLLCTFSGAFNTQASSIEMTDAYLEQEKPGLTPKLFAPDIIATDKYRETEVVFLPDMSEFAFTRLGGEYKKPALIVMQHQGNKWLQKSIPAADAKTYRERFSPSVSEMQRHEVFKDIPIIGFAKSASNTYYFYVLNFQDGSGHLSYSRFINGTYEKPVKMSNAVNRGKYIAHPYIAPDESYIMWDAEKDDENTPDIYISFRQQDGSWSDAINMGETINTDAYEQRPKVTPDGKFLFFWRGDKKTRADGSTYWTGNPHWVDAKFIETLRPQQ